ncbi:hypothetical protein [Novosphingobium sp. FKTRR1]|uniref:hypothetical protein n=1 Tax=Novosphingobium sp. FKTRR1 TaxID=2879118 RepID=UPI001CF05E5A|nr:hypothetical protein [Novosphingobium sp. FKTRR1]
MSDHILVRTGLRCAAAFTFSGLALSGLAIPGSAIAAEAPLSNPKPTKADWAAIADLPDLSGVWSPGPLDRYVPGSPEAPQWLPAIASQIDKLKQLDAEGKPQNIYTNCLPEGLPSSVTQTLNAVEFLVTPGRVTVLGEFDGNRTRRIWTDGRPHPADPDPSFSGHSIGHWEGQALVVDTVGILPEVFIPLSQGVGFPNNGGMHVEERIALTGPDTLKVDLVVHAPKVLAAPWHVSRTFTRHRDRSYDIVESSCRQGDFFEDTDANGNAVFSPIPKDAGGAPVPPDQPNAAPPAASPAVSSPGAHR